MTTQVTRAAGLVIFRKLVDSIEYLLLQTSYGEHHWTPPKGHVDPGEDEYTAAVRETKEEAGVEESDLKIFKDIKKTLQYNVKGKPKTVVYWLAELINPDSKITLSDEHQDLKWLTLHDACILSHYKEMQDLLRFFEEEIRLKP